MDNEFGGYAAAPEDSAEMPGYRKIYRHQYEFIEKQMRANNSSMDRGSAREEAELLLEPLFGSMSRREGGPKSKYDYFRWDHRRPSQYHDDIENMSADPQRFRSGVAQYLRLPYLQSEYLDWFCADVMAYHQFSAFFEPAEMMLNGSVSTALLRLGGWGVVGGYALRVLGFLVKWAIWVAGILFVGATNELVAWVLVAATIAYLVWRWRKRKQIADRLAAMQSAYEIFETTTFSWEVAWRALNTARDLGAVWPGELYKLVELRRLVLTAQK